MVTSSPRVRFAPSVWNLRPAQQNANAGNLLSFATGAWPSPGMHWQQDRALQTLSGSTMGTSWSLRLVNPEFLPLAPIQALVQSTLDNVIAQMSHWEPDSDLSRFNQAPAGSWHTLEPEFGRVLDAAWHWCVQSGGAWDPSIGALVNLWGFGPRAQPQAPHDGQTPDALTIANALQHCGYERLRWNRAQRQLHQPGGVELDLSGIAKGFAVDWVTERLQDAGWSNALLEIGGELRAWGHRPGGDPWQVALAGHAATPDHASMRLALKEGSLATSGDHWHVFESNGQRYSHTLDPHTGCPVAQALTSVTVWHQECMQADAIATVLTVLGPEDGWSFALERGIAAVLHRHPDPQHPQGQQRITPAWSAIFPS